MSSLRFAKVNRQYRALRSLCHGFCHLRHAAIISTKTHATNLPFFTLAFSLRVFLRSVKAQACGSKAIIIFDFRLIIIFTFALMIRSFAAGLISEYFDMGNFKTYQNILKVFKDFLS